MSGIATYPPPPAILNGAHLTGQDFIRARELYNLSQKGMADMLGVGTQNIQAWETGKINPSKAVRTLYLLLLADHEAMLDVIVKAGEI